AVTFDEKLSFKSPVRETEEAWTPRQQALEDRAEAEAEAAATRPYEEAEYRAFPRVGSRVAIWVVAQLHLLFAAFVLA
ncbi:MAG: hypothetical protein GWN46_11795, partial [Gammaproteobacteria bacterium]|nr:hypothetical protein [Pseudomonadales bacterium]NIV47433.1 hypothetical protein [Gammaproteobacteria bacterium]NIX07709.1 hypothetical protein [Pseudomonadales bacterium]